MERIEDTIEAWETGKLGREAEFAKPLDAETWKEERAAIDAALGLKPISIRMEVEALETLKIIAKHRGLGYQPLIRQIIHRWIECELKQIALESMGNEESELKVLCDTRKAA